MVFLTRLKQPGGIGYWVVLSINLLLTTLRPKHTSLGEIVLHYQNEGWQALGLWCFSEQWLQMIECNFTLRTPCKMNILLHKVMKGSSYWRKVEYKPTILRCKPNKTLYASGIGWSRKIPVFEGSGLTPCLEITYPRYVYYCKKRHFVSFGHKVACCNLLNISWRWLKCLSNV